ncbi:hypothetical protein [Longispora fulva]|uniref:Uncharacterized protein n=1 Tax=Longispora fulva TaxID=619741 RepID=A0A8J7GAV8_9ACTN|nr:hypothetical protein [Longispora fulva]MBG6133991.1 hypothetical protein [Longispora fulva]
MVNLRRLRRHDPIAPGWSVIGRLLRPLDAVNAALDSPPTTHRRRAMDDAVAVIVLRCARVGRSYWGWTAKEWAEVIGADQPGFRHSAPAWADDAVRPYLSAQAYLLGGFNEFHRLGSFGRLTLAWRVFGRDRVDAEIGRIREVLAEWGYRLGRDDDQLLPMVVCQVFLLNRSPRLEDLSTELFERIRREKPLHEHPLDHDPGQVRQQAANTVQSRHLGSTTNAASRNLGLSQYQASDGTPIVSRAASPRLGSEPPRPPEWRPVTRARPPPTAARPPYLP